VFGPTRYLGWARRFYGQVRCDLATSGMPSVPLSELGVPDAATLDDPTGWPRLEAAIAHHNARPEAEAVAALGTTHALWLAYASLTSPGDEVLVETPGYEPLTRIAEGMGLTVRTFERPAAVRFALDPDRVARAMTPRTRVVAVTNLHNPGGVRAPDATLRAVADVAAARGASLLVDEVYAPFDALADASGVFHGSARGLAPNVVAVSSLTKCYGLSAHRVGWMLAAPDVASRARDAVTASCGMLPLPYAHLALRAFDRIGTFAERVRPLAARRARVGAWVASQGLSWSEPAEGLFGFVNAPASGDLTPAIERSATNGGILVAPGAFFGAADGFRIAWARPIEVVEEGLALLAPILRARPG
jgi:aspartate/methionine/tyrosine aminotransferase